MLYNALQKNTYNDKHNILKKKTLFTSLLNQIQTP